MTKKIIFIYSLVVFLTSVSTDAQVFRTYFSSISIDNKKIADTGITEVKINSAASLTFNFTNDFDDSTDKTIYYVIHLNDRVISKNYKSESYTFNSLAEGDYIFSVQAFNGNKQESVPVVKLFSVTKPLTPKQNSKDLIIQLSFLEIILTIFSILILLTIFIISRKNKSKKTKKAKPSLADDVFDEISELRESNKNLKSSYKLFEEENKKLNKIISGLNKSIVLLEDANVNLIEQKEALFEKKIKLEELQKQKDELIAIKFHDIKNPASAIKGLIELLESYDLTATEQQEIMESLVASSSSIIDLVQEMSVSFAKKSYDEEYIMKLSFLQEVVKSVMSINSAYAKKKQIRLLNNTSVSIPQFYFDPPKLKEAIDNLVNNAIKYSLPNTDVTIRSFLTETKVVVEVKDNGVGIPQDEISMLFKKGAMLSPRPTGGEQSSGLGLWIVKKIIEGHGGTIKVESRQGVGSKFTFELPFKKD